MAALPRALVTGASGTFGAEIAAGLVAAGFETLCCVRDAAKGDALIARLNAPAAVGGGAGAGAAPVVGIARSVVCDVSSSADIARMAASIGPAPLCILVANAAVASSDRRVNADGVEATFGTNVLGYHRVLRALLPQLALAPAPRVVFVASQYAGGLSLADPEYKARVYDSHGAYRASKQANRMSARGWASRAPGLDIYSCHPGTADSGVARGLEVAFSASVEAARAGAATPLYVALAPKASLERSGAYYVQSRAQACPFAADAKNIGELMALLDSYR